PTKGKPFPMAGWYTTTLDFLSSNRGVRAHGRQDGWSAGWWTNSARRARNLAINRCDIHQSNCDRRALQISAAVARASVCRATWSDNSCPSHNREATLPRNLFHPNGRADTATSIPAYYRPGRGDTYRRAEATRLHTPWFRSLHSDMQTRRRSVVPTTDR